MKKFYETLLSVYDKTEDGIFHVNLDNVIQKFKEAGWHIYDFGGEQILSKRELTPEEYAAHKQEYDDGINVMVEDLTKTIDKKILKEILKENKYDTVKQE